MIYRDLIFALRSVRKTPLFSFVVIVTLALAVGANAAVFSVLRAVVLAPLPYSEPRELVAVYTTDRSGASGAMSLPNGDDVRAQNRTFTDVAISITNDATITGSGKPRVLAGVDTTWPAFEILGIRPQLGRFFTAQDERAGRGAPVIISDHLWRTAFGADARVVGRTLTLDAQAYRVIGVAPVGFRFPMPLGRNLLAADFWTLLRPHDDLYRGDREFAAMARLRPGVSIAAANADVARVAAELARRYPKEDGDTGASVSSFADAFIGPVRLLLIAAFAAVVGVAIVACANVANLFLSRGAARDVEIAIRFAMGATRRRIVAQLLTEMLVFAVVSGALGIVLAWALIQGFIALHPSGIPRLDELRIDGDIVAYTVGVVGLCALASGIVPAVAVSRPQLTDALKAAGRGGDTSRGARTRNAFVVLEIAISVALVATSGLIVRSFVTLANTPLGVTTNDVRVASLGLPSSTRYQSSAQIARFYRDTAARVRAIPGVRTAGWASGKIPFIGGGATGVKIEGHPRPAGNDPLVNDSVVGPEYFSALDIPLKTGRVFTSSDRLGSAPVALVNEAFVREYFNGNVLGHWIIPSTGVTLPYPRYTIVGVVANVRNSFAETYAPSIYFPLAQIPFSNASLLVRTLPGVHVDDAAIGAAVTASDPLLAAPEFQPLQFYADRALARTRLSALLLGSLGVVALFLALAGVYAVVSFGVAQRTQEFGIRMALGSRASAIVRDVLARASGLVIIGILSGAVLAGLAAGLVRSELFGVSTLDPITYAIVVAFVAIAALLASLIPALRATSVDPVVALRQP